MAASPYQHHVNGHEAQHAHKTKLFPYYRQYKIVLRFRQIQVLLYAVPKAQTRKSACAESQQRLYNLPSVVKSMGKRIEEAGYPGKPVPI